MNIISPKGSPALLPWLVCTKVSSPCIEDQELICAALTNFASTGGTPDSAKAFGSLRFDIKSWKISGSKLQFLKSKTASESEILSENTKNLLAKIGVDFAQGHVVGKPAPLEDLLAQIGSNSQSSTA